MGKKEELLTGVAIILVILVFTTYFRTGLVPRYPMLIVSGFLVLTSIVLMIAGQILADSKRQFDQLFEIFNAK